MDAATLSRAIVNDIIRGECGDPFAVLGPHVFRDGPQSGVAIRAAALLHLHPFLAQVST